MTNHSEIIAVGSGIRFTCSVVAVMGYLLAQGTIVRWIGYQTQDLTLLCQQKNEEATLMTTAETD